jgi:arsenical pump membrane protein
VTAVALLIVGVVTMFVRPLRVPLWAGPVAAAGIGLIAGIVRWGDASNSLHLLVKPLLFLLFAVPLAVVLDHIGVFSAFAAMVDGGEHLAAWLWFLAAAVTVVFNLDASVVLLTPLYIRIAQRHGYSPEMLAFQPALLACLASNPLPVSNLTNLIVAEHFNLSVGQFVWHLSVPTIAACAVGWLGFRRVFAIEPPGSSSVDLPIDRCAVRQGLPIVGFVLIGFTVGAAFGVPEWMVAAAAVAWGAVIARHIPFRAIPHEAMLVASGLSVLVAGAASRLSLARIFDATGMLGRLRTLLFGVIASDLSNNLPAVLAGMRSLHDRSQVWPLLIGANVGPALVLSGALSGLLWRDTAANLGVEVSAGRYSYVGLKVGLPALAVASALVVLL